MRAASIILFSAVILSGLGCNPVGDGRVGFPEIERARPKVVAVNYPLGFFAEYLGGDSIEVDYPFRGKGDPAFWSPSEAAMGEIMEADLILLNGAGYAKWADGAFLPIRKTIVSCAGLEDQLIPAQTESHRHGPDGGQDHGKVAFTTWLDFELATLQASRVAEAIKSLPGIDEGKVDDQLVELKLHIDKLSLKMKTVSKRLQGRRIFASHPVYQYLGNRYGISIHSFHWEPDAEVSDEEWRKFDQFLKEENPVLMLWEAEPIEGHRIRLDQHGVPMTVFSPCGDVPLSGDLLSVFDANIDALLLMIESVVPNKNE
ncbi:metal ABC transporter substrate-binding protein [bacterium]|nr:metal ABC transporter substrate-binding protein [bacterium]